MTRRHSLAVLGLLGLWLATADADAGWGRRRRPASPDHHATTRDDRANAWTPYRFDHEGYQGYNFGAFDIPAVRAHTPNASAPGFPLLRFPLHWRRSSP